MTGSDAFSHLSPTATEDLFRYFSDNDKPAYKACLQMLANRRKLRLVFVERKSKPERHEWMRAELARKSNEDIAIELIQTWLLTVHKAMICQFLDSLGVSHDGNGLLETLPAEPSEEKLQASIDALLASNSPEIVSIYLRLFSAMDIANWPTLEKILTNDPRLCPAPTHPA